MNVKMVGHGSQTVVLAHGYGGSQALWDDVVPGLSEKYRVLVFDWRFDDGVMEYVNGDSGCYYDDLADEVVSLLERMGLKGVVFVGHSMSGMIGCIASAKKPELFSRLVLVGASPRYLNAENYEGGLQETDIENMLSTMKISYLTWVEDFTKLVVGNNHLNSIEKFRKDLKKMKPEVALSLAKIIFSSDCRDMLDKVEVPCTIVQTTNDPVVPSDIGNYMQRKIKGATTVKIIEMDGHFPQLIEPMKLICVIEQAIDEMVVQE